MPNRVQNRVAHAHSLQPDRALPLVCQTSSRMLTSQQAHRAMLKGVRNAVALAHLAASSSCHAQRCAKTRRACPPRSKLIVPCSKVCETPSRMPTSRECHGTMLKGVRKVVWQRSGQPNRRLQRTALAPSEIVRFLKGGIGPSAFSL
jgi:hypothetical protein